MQRKNTGNIYCSVNISSCLELSITHVAPGSLYFPDQPHDCFWWCFSWSICLLSLEFWPKLSNLGHLDLIIIQNSIRNIHARHLYTHSKLFRLRQSCVIGCYNIWSHFKVKPKYNSLVFGLCIIIIIASSSYITEIGW